MKKWKICWNVFCRNNKVYMKNLYLRGMKKIVWPMDGFMTAIIGDFYRFNDASFIVWQAGKKWFSWKYFQFKTTKSGCTFLLLLFFFLHLFHYLAFAIAMHCRPCLINAIFGVSRSIGIIISNDKALAEGLCKKGYR